MLKNRKRALKKLVITEILASKARYLSILLLVLIGVAFFSGINSSGPDMLNTAALYFDKQQLMDIRLVSTYGLEEEDIRILSQQPDIQAVEGGYSQDVVTDKDFLLKVFSCDEDQQLNQCVVKSGRLPEASGEIALIDSKKLRESYSIGDMVTFVPDSEDNELSEQFKKTSYRVVGFITSPLYLSDKNIGSSSVGKGSLDGYGVIVTADFNLSVYTEAYVTFKSLQNVNPYGESYGDTINKYQKDIEAAFEERANTRYEEIKREAEEKLQDAREETADGKQQLADGQKELEDAKNQIDDGRGQITDAKARLAAARQKIDDGYKEYETNKADFDSQIAEAQAQLDDGAGQINKARNEVYANYEQIEAGNEQIENAFTQIEEQESALLSQKAQLEQFLSQAEQIITIPAGSITLEQQQELIQAGSLISLGDNTALGNLWTAYFNGRTNGDAVTGALRGVLTEIENGLTAVSNSKSELQARQQELADAKAQLDSGNIVLNASALSFEEKSKEFEEKKAEGENELTSALERLRAAEAEYEEGRKKLEEENSRLSDAEKEYEKGLAEFTEKKADAEKDIAEAEEAIADGEEQLAELKVPKYYVLSREDNSHYGEYTDAADNLAALSLVFPTFFFAIAALISLTTITRMIEEQRVQIGTLKALGYTTGEICLKYYIYALSAGLIGSFLGLAVGFQVIPRIIFGAYGVLYDLPDKQFTPYLSFSIISIGIALFSTGFSAWMVLHQELKSTPSVLMRPKAPKAGKRIFLERISFIWDRLSFNQKVALRNLFRYKPRMIMTVFGITGCMGLLVTGFGLNDSISDVSALQYETIINYQALVVFDEEAEKKDLDAAKEGMAVQKGIDDFLLIHQGQYQVKEPGANTQQVLVIVPQETERLNQYVLLRNRVSKKTFSLPDNGAVITEKLAHLFNAGVGDSLTLTDSDNQEFTVTIAEITENYAGHYLYLSPKAYQSSFHAAAISYNGALLQYGQDTKWQEELNRTLNGYSAVKAISNNSSTISTFKDSMDSLNAVVLVLIISAGSLAFVVLYNLTNINVSERIRELSTIKVLGFYDKEVTMYIYRENIILSFFGIFFGSFLGIFLLDLVLETASMDNIMFSKTLHLHSYLYGGLLTFIFSVMVMWAMHRKLKRVDMIEALKSNE